MASTTPTPRTFTLASRASQLAQIQTNIVKDALSALPSAPVLQTSFMSTAGDKNQSVALYLVGGKSLWTKELEVALLEGEVDMLVHSFKDVPTVLPEGCIIAGILEREDPVDSVVMKAGIPEKTLGELKDGSVVGTSSVRRVAQLKRNFPGLIFQDVRGNLNTRLAKLDDPTNAYSALILAKSGLVRLGMGHRITSDLGPPTLYHAVSQGALAIEIRENDEAALDLCKQITHPPTELRCRAERACLRVLEGGCSVPVGVASSLSEDGTTLTLTLTGCVTSLDGSEHVEHTLVKSSVGTVGDADELGERLARALMDAGAKAILNEITKDRERRQAEAAESEQGK